MSLPAADKPVWEIKMKGAGCLREVLAVWFLLLYTKANNVSLLAPPAMLELEFPHLLGRILVTWGCLSLKLAFWGAGRKAAHLWELFFFS